MSTRQVIAALIAGIALFALTAGSFGAGRLTASHAVIPPPVTPVSKRVGPSPRTIAEHELYREAQSAQVAIVFLQWNGETIDDLGRRVENFTVRLNDRRSAFQMAVVLARQDWDVVDVRHFN